MLRILSSKRYWSLIGQIADNQNTIKNQADLINRQAKTIQGQLDSIEYLNEKLNNRTEEVRALRNFISTHKSFLDLDFPNSSDTKAEDINKILGL